MTRSLKSCAHVGARRTYKTNSLSAHRRENSGNRKEDPNPLSSKNFAFYQRRSSERYLRRTLNLFLGSDTLILVCAVVILP